jgi:hypothetical protein
VLAEKLIKTIADNKPTTGFVVAGSKSRKLAREFNTVATRTCQISTVHFIGLLYFN